MKRQSATPPKKRGPPATGKGEPILVRLQPAQLAALDAWMGRQDAGLSRPEAIRRLLAANELTIRIEDKDYPLTPPQFAALKRMNDYVQP